MPPAPPKATSAKSRGSWPRSTETTRIARSMLALATRTMPSASRRHAELQRRATSRGDAGARDRRRASSGRRERYSRIEPAEQQVRVGDRELRAGAVADRARARRRRSAARRAARRRCRRSAIDPPPAPTVWMSITGSRTGKVADPSTRSSSRCAPSIRLTSVDVPPMSNEITRGKPAASRDGPRADDAGRRPRQHRAHGLRARGRAPRSSRRSTA